MPLSVLELLLIFNVCQFEFKSTLLFTNLQD